MMHLLAVTADNTHLSNISESVTLPPRYGHAMDREVVITNIQVLWSNAKISDTVSRVIACRHASEDKPSSGNLGAITVLILAVQALTFNGNDIVE